MKLALAFLLVAVAMAMASDADDWANYKKEFGKNYEGEEDQTKMKIFLENKKHVDEHNAKFEKGEVTYKQKLNKFSDETPEEHSKHKGFGTGDGEHHHHDHVEQH